SGGPPPGLVNNWTNPASGNWEDLKWSLGILPASNQTIMITNQGWKAVAIGPNTVQNFAQTLSVSNVFLGGYTDSFNVLLLNYAGLQTPLVIGPTNYYSGSLVVGSNSSVMMLSSALQINNALGMIGSELGAFSIGGTFI